MELDLLKLLAGAGDVGTLALVFALWRIDKRLFRVELITDHLQKNSG